MLFFAVNYVAVWGISAPTHTSVPLSRQFRPGIKSATKHIYIYVKRTGGLLSVCSLHFCFLWIKPFQILLLKTQKTWNDLPYPTQVKAYSTRLKDWITHFGDTVPLTRYCHQKKCVQARPSGYKLLLNKETRSGFGFFSGSVKTLWFF
jgi:hypothetical protein